MIIKFFKNILHPTKSKNIFILEKKDKYTKNFSKQWKTYRDVQIDSINKSTISKNFLIEIMGKPLNFLRHKEVLELGSGAGRFTEYFAKYCNHVVSIDLSNSILSNVEANNPKVTFIKADMLKLKSNKKFDIVFCRGVLQHTPNPLKSIKKIHTFVKKNGVVIFDIYKKPFFGNFHPKYLYWRGFFQKIISYERCELFLKKNIQSLIKIRKFFKILFFNSNVLADFFIPLWEYKGTEKIDKKNIYSWAILDTLDGLYAKYDYPYKNNEIKSFLRENNIKIIKINLKRNSFVTKV